MTNPDLKHLVRHLQQILDKRLDAVVLFGSRARGTSQHESDWDLLIVVHDLPTSPLQRWQWFHKQTDQLPPDTDILLKTPEEWYAHLSSLTLDVALDGQILYDAHGRMHRFLEKTRDTIQKAGLYREFYHGHYLWRTASREKHWYKRLQEALGV